MTPMLRRSAPPPLSRRHPPCSRCHRSQVSGIARILLLFFWPELHSTAPLRTQHPPPDAGVPARCCSAADPALCPVRRQLLVVLIKRCHGIDDAEYLAAFSSDDVIDSGVVGSTAADKTTQVQLFTHWRFLYSAFMPVLLRVDRWNMQ